MKNIFFEIEQDINKDINIIEKEYKKNQYVYYIIKSGDNWRVSYGLLKGINSKDIKYYCNTLKGSSDSPIITLKNNKVIVIHKGSPIKIVINLIIGIFIKEVLNLLYKDLQNVNMNKIINKYELSIFSEYE